MTTERDFDIIDFVSKFKVVTTSMIADVFFPNVKVCRRRLAVLVKNGHLKRSRESQTNEFIYFIKQPRQIRHSLKVAEFYAKLIKTYEVKKFRIEPPYGSVRPDSSFIFVDHSGKTRIGLLEVELSNKGVDFKKYDKFFIDEYLQHMTVRPIVYVVSKTAFKKDGFVYIPIKFKNIELV